MVAYKGFIQAWVDAAKVADPDAAALRQYAQGDALKDLVNILFGSQLQKKYVRGELGTAPYLIESQPSDVPIRVFFGDCLDDRQWLEHKASGELWDDKPGGRSALQAGVVKTGAGWKVTVFSLQKYGSC